MTDDRDWALSSQSCANDIRSPVHWDRVLIQRPEYGGGEVWFDGELIRKNGRFLPKSLSEKWNGWHRRPACAVRPLAGRNGESATLGRRVLDFMRFARDIPVGGSPTGTGVVARSTHFQTGSKDLQGLNPEKLT